MTTSRLILFFSFIHLASGQVLTATTLLRYDLNALTQNAERILVGTCESTATELVRDQVYTLIRFKVQETIKGEPTDELVLHFPGGQYQDISSHIVGMPTFSVGEEVILFLTQEDKLGHAWPVGLAQGKFSIQRKGPAAKAHVFQELDGISLYPPSTGPAAKKTLGSSSMNGFPLDEFLARVRALVVPRREGSDDVH